MGTTRIKRANFDVILDDAVAAGKKVVEMLPVIAKGERWKLRCFGASEVGNGDGKASTVTLQLRTQTSPAVWKTIRAYGIVSTCCEVALSRVIRGNGIRRLRIVRSNHSTEKKVIFAWLEGHKVP